MLIKRKKKPFPLVNLEGTKFIHHDTTLIYSISKKENEQLFTISWGGDDSETYAGYAKYSEEDIISNIEKGIWKIVY